MSDNELAYLSLVIFGFVAFAVSLAWVSWWSRRGEKSDRPSQPVTLLRKSENLQHSPQRSSRAA